MTRIILLLPILITVLSGCASQKTGDSAESNSDLPAPVRESSILAMEEPPVVQILSESDGPTSEQLVTSESEVTDPVEDDSDLSVDKAYQISSGEPAESAQSEASVLVRTETPRIIAPKEVAVRVETEEELAPTVTEILPEVATIPAEKTVLDEESGESDVLAYLLDEAQNSFEKENYEKARGQSERALTLEPNAARAYLILARIELLDGNNEVAAELAKKGLSTSADSSPIFEQLNEVLGELAERGPSATTTAPDILPAGQIQ